MADGDTEDRSRDGAPYRDDTAQALDVTDTLSDASLVVASNRERCYSSETAPEWLDVVVRTDKGRNYARNRAIEEAENEWIIIADDDITFPTRLAAHLVDSMHEFQVVGLEDFWPMRWTLTRFMIFHRSLWERVGGFDENREHGGDTDFAIRAEKAGAEVHRLPRRIVPHHDTESDFDVGTHLEWLFYLFKRHPKQVAVPALKLALAKVNVISPSKIEYGASWTGDVFSLSDTGDPQFER